MFQIAIAAGFQSVWYWLLSAVLWLRACRPILGVPHGMVRRAVGDPQAQALIEQAAHLAAERIATLHDRLGVPIAAGVGFGLAVLFVVGFVYQVEFGQAGFLLAFPLAATWHRTVRLALRVRRERLGGAPLRRALLRRRLWNIAFAAAALFAAGAAALSHHPYLFPR